MTTNSALTRGRLGPHKVARVGFGAMQLERLHTDRAAALELLRHARDLGVDHFDTAYFYGNGFVNELLRDALRDDDDVVIVSKVGAEPDPTGRRSLRPAQRPEQLRAAIEANLVSLGVDRIPVVNLRRLDARPGLRAEGDQIVDLDDQLAVLIDLRDAGTIGEIGLSAVTIDGLRRALPARVVCVQNAYSLLARHNDDMLALCEAEGIAWVPFFPLGSAIPGLPKVIDNPVVTTIAAALGRTPAQVGLAWLLHHSANALLIPGTAHAGHLTANVAAGSIELDDATMATLDAIDSRPLDMTFHDEDDGR